MKAILRTLSVVGFLATGITGVQAADTTWSFSSDNNSNITNIGGSNWGNTFEMTQGTNILTISAWSDTREATSPDSIQSAKLRNNSSGLLNYNRNGESAYNSSHAIDNEKDNDMLLFNFTEAVSLSSLTLGWVGKDSDITIAAFSSLPTLAGSNWTDVASDAVFKTSITNVGLSSLDLAGTTTEANYWIIGAYNSFITPDGWTEGNDFLKLASLSTQPATPIDVPAPATAVLMLFSLGLIGLRRRQK